MQVRKFEARSMKEALEMVKTQMGPDAVILAVKDMSKKFGLVGQGSIEITAAASEHTLNKKKFIESRLSEDKKENFAKIPARQQKVLIDKYVNRHLERNASSGKPQGETLSGSSAQRARKYIDIVDEETDKISAPDSDDFVSQENFQRREVALSEPQRAPRDHGAESREVQNLKQEILELRRIVAEFQKIPQSLMNSQQSGFPGSDYGLTYDLSTLFQKLTAVGLFPQFAAEILSIAQDSIPAIKMKNQSLVEAWVARYLLSVIKTSERPTAGKVHCFIGPSGSGKTTHLIKLASHIAIKEKRKVAVITTDSMKVGAIEQMKIFAQILNVPFAVVRHQRDWQQMLNYFETVDCVLVDFAGLSMRNQTEMELVRSLLPPTFMEPRIHLVLSSLTKDSDLTDIGRRYSVLGYQDAIFTSIDESVQHGVILNFMRRFDVPLHSFGIGSRIPEDFEFATKERVLDLVLRITEQVKEKSV